MYAQSIEWKEVKFKSQKTNGRYRMVWLTKSMKDIASPNVLKITPDLVNELGWKSGTRANLYKSGCLFKFTESNTGLVKFKLVGKTLTYTNWALCAELHPDVNGTEFEAWVDGGELYFKPKEG